MAPTGQSVATGIVINVVVALIGIVVFSLVRVWKKSYKFYDPKRYTPSIVDKPNTVPPGLFGWVSATFFYSEPDVIRQCGLDTAIYLRLLRFGTELFLYVSFFALAAILPTNLSDDNVDMRMSEPGSNYKYSDFDKVSLANVQEGSQRMWVHIFMVYIISFITLKLLWRYSNESVLLRLQFLGNSKPGGMTHSVLVTDIPAIADGTASMKTGNKDEMYKAMGKDVEQGGGMALGSPSPSPAAYVGKGKDMPAVDRMPRQRKTFNYDLNTTSLDPKVMAQEKLALLGSPTDLVRDEFSLVYDGDVQEVQIMHDQSALDALVTEYNKRKLQLEDYLDAVAYHQSKGEHLPAAKVTLLFPDAWCKERYGGGMMKKVDGLPFWRNRLQYLEQRIEEEQQKARSKLWPTAFVTFKSRVSQSVSATGLHHHDETTWNIRNAPGPEEVVWENLGMTGSRRSTASSIMWVAFWLLTMFYLIPVGFVQGLIDVPKYTKDIPGLNEFFNNAVVKKLVEAIVPGLALKIFLALLPMILAFMVKKSGAISLSEIDFGVVTRFFIFQVIIVFVGNVLASSFFSQAQEWIKNPTGVFNILGSAIPQSATFFITFIWVSVGALGIGLIRIVGLILYWLFTKLAYGPKAKERVYQEQYNTYGTSVTGHMIVMLVGVIFSCINPIICPSALVYFAFAMLCEKYNNVFVYRRRYESGGQMWVRILNQVMTALYIYQITMIGLISIKKFPYSPIIIPVLLPTVFFHITVLKLFARPWTIVSLHDAAELDKNDQDEVVESHLFLPPAFKVEPGQAAPLIAQAEAVEPVVKEDIAKREAEEAAKKNKQKSAQQL